MTTMDLDQIINAYSETEMDVSVHDEKSLQAALEKTESMVERLEAENRIDELFPEEIVEPVIASGASEIEQKLDSIFESKMPDFIEDEIVEKVEILEVGVSVSPLNEIVEEASAKIEQEDHAAIADEHLLQEIKNIPDRLAFKIGDVAEIVDVKQYVLRYWESEFDCLKPKKSRQNQRMYTRKDVENILMIKKLLYRDKFSIEGARRAMKNLKTQVKENKQWDAIVDRYDHAIEMLNDLKGDISIARSKLAIRPL